MNFQAFDHYVDSHVELWLQQLSDFCRIPSISTVNGPAMAEAAGLVMDLLQQRGIATEAIPQSSGPPLILGRAGAGPRRLMIYNHYDVQPPDPLDEWASPPFQPELREGKLFARGVADNKADLLARVLAVGAYQELMGPLPVQVLYVIEGEEEIGSPHLMRFAVHAAEVLGGVDGCLWEYGYKNTGELPVVNLGAKGIFAAELRVRTGESDAHSANGGLFPNAAWRLVEALSTLRAPDGRVLIEGLMDHVRAPSENELALLQRIPFDDQAVQRSAGLSRPFLGQLQGQAALQRLLLEPTCSINGIVSGYTGPGSKTVIPAAAKAKLDIRLVPDLTPSLALQLLRSHLDRRGFADVEIVDHKDGLMPARTSPTALIARSVVAALVQVHNVDPVVQPSSAGSGPMHELCGIHGIPVASTGVAWYGSRAHAPNESVRVADFIQGIKVIGRLLHTFATVPDGLS